MEYAKFRDEFQSLAAQLRSDAMAEQWWAMKITPRNAARWATLGFMPGEAQSIMRGGETLERLWARNLCESGIHSRCGHGGAYFQ